MKWNIKFSFNWALSGYSYSFKTKIVKNLKYRFCKTKNKKKLVMEKIKSTCREYQNSNFLHLIMPRLYFLFSFSYIHLIYVFFSQHHMFPPNNITMLTKKIIIFSLYLSILFLLFVISYKCVFLYSFCLSNSPDKNSH